MRAIAALLATLLVAFAGTAGAHAETFGAERYQPDMLQVPVDHYVGFTAHADGLPSAGGSISGAVKGATLAVASAVALAIVGALAVGPDVSTETLAFALHLWDVVSADPGAALAFTPAIVALRKRKAGKLEEARAILDKAETEERSLTEDEAKAYDALEAEARTINADIERHERQAEAEKELEERTPVQTLETGDVEETRSTVPGAPAAARAGEDRGRDLRMANNVLQLFRGVATNNMDLVRRAQSSLAAEGHYGEEARKAVESRAAGDYYSTIVDADGKVLLPTVVSDGIDRIGERVGVVRNLCTTFPHVKGEIKVPGATGTIIANAIGEGGVIKSSLRAFQAVTLNPQKWAAIIPWTYEVNEEAGARVLEDAEWGIAQAFERARDNGVINGDGSGAFNGIDGVLSANRTDVGNYVLAAGKTSFDDFDARDAKLMRRQIPPFLRGMGAYVFHPDMEPILELLQNGNGQYIYAYDSEGRPSLGGRPVSYTEVLPGSDDDAVSTVFGIYGYWPMIKIALGQGMTSETLDQAIIRNANDDGDINLATQDLRAVKCREFWDADMNFEEAFCKATTAAS